MLRWIANWCPRMELPRPRVRMRKMEKREPCWRDVDLVCNKDSTSCPGNCNARATARYLRRVRTSLLKTGRPKMRGALASRMTGTPLLPAVRDVTVGFWCNAMQLK